MADTGFSIRLKVALCLAGTLVSTGCGNPAVDGAVGFGALGAGAGAIVGSVIKNGDVAASAALGGAIGIPIGIAIAVMQQPQSDENLEKERLAIIRRNQSILFEQQRDIDVMRDQVNSEAPQLQMPEEDEDAEDPYLGTTLGNPYR